MTDCPSRTPRPTPTTRMIWRLLRAAGCTAWLLAGCNTGKLLEVEVPSVIGAEEFLVPRNAALIVNGAISDFECALAEYAVAGGLVGNELEDAQLNASMWDYDRRTMSASTGVYQFGTGCPTFNDNVAFVYAPISVAPLASRQCAGVA